MERAFGADLGDVRLHTGREARALCRLVNARAFTVDAHVFCDDSSLLAHELAHVLQRETGVVRRVVQGARGPMSHAAVRAKVDAEDGKSLTAAATAAEIDVDALVADYVEAADTYYLAHLYDELRRRIKANSFTENADSNIDGVRLQYKDCGADGVDQSFAVAVSTEKVDVHAGKMLFHADFAVQLDEAERGEWTLGLVQTVLSAHREVQLVARNHAVQTVTMSIDSPTNDRRDGSGPWYDDFQSSQLLDRDFQDVRVSLDDGPGFSIGKDAQVDLLAMSGRDEYRTWLVLRRGDGWLLWLFSWDWRIDYSQDGGQVKLTAMGWFPDGSGAVLDGDRAVEAVRTEKTVTQPPHEDEVVCEPGCIVS
jgi:hypothetical protein